MLVNLAANVAGCRRLFSFSSVHRISAGALLITIAVASQFVYVQQLQAEEAAHPNIIFIMADDLGYGDLGCFGQKVIQTPHLDQMCAEGMKFTDFYAGSTVCAPSRCVLMTGYHTGRTFIRGNGKDNLRPEDVTVGEVMKSGGYRTGMFGKWGLGHEDSSGLPTKQGFDEFFGYLDQHHAHNYYPTFLIQNGKRQLLKNIVPKEGKWGQGVATDKVDYSHDMIFAHAMQFLKDNRDETFFMYLPLTIPHANNEAGKAGMEIPDLGIYADKDWPEPVKGHAAMITKMDSDLGQLFAKLKEYGIDENTLVIFTSDNGPHAEGGNNPAYHDSNGPLKGIKRALTEGGIRVPTIARWPGKIKAGSTTNHVGCFQDIMPTFAAFAGSEKAVPDDIDGISFAPTLLGMPEKQAQHEYLYWAFYEQGGAEAIRKGDWKAVKQPRNTPIRLYNLANDIGEENDLASEHPEMVAEMQKHMEEAYEPSPRWKFPQPKPKRN